MKKLLCVFLALFTLALTGCEKDNTAAETTGGTVSAAEESETKIETDTEITSDTEPAADVEETSYSGEKYEFSYDPSKWELSFEPDTDNPILLRKDFELSITFVSAEIFDYGLEVCADGLKDTYDMMGYVCTADEIREINGTEWLFIDFEKDKFMLHIRTAFGDGRQYTVKCSAEKEQFEKGYSDFEEVFDGFKITE